MECSFPKCNISSILILYSNLKTTPSVSFEALFSQIWFLFTFRDQGFYQAWCRKRWRFRCKVLERDFISHWKVPPALWTPLCLSEPCTRPCAYQSAQAAENGGPPRSAPWEELHFQELQLRSASDELQEGQGSCMKWRWPITTVLLMDFRRAVLVENG